MTTWAIGDVHGQAVALEKLLDRSELGTTSGELWLVGDLVNRGPDSLGVLRLLRQLEGALGERLFVVLGNHDLLLLAFAAGIGQPRKRDTVDAILEAPDREELLAWLRTRPLLHRRGTDVLVHAGLLAQWTIAEAEARAREAEVALRGDGCAEVLADWRGGIPVAEAGRERRRQTLSVMTGIRTCTAAGVPCDFTGPPPEAPAGCRPWFAWEGRRSAGYRIFFGHWAALGLHVAPGVVGLDTGAASGGCLTAYRLEDGAIFQEPVERVE